ncbi:hypothetical protein [Thioflexithrix psekupsensis]|uniref:hypothetical protein n=1 Tax=Thioflexithrix psekupsensis TaxID=1570016 RepID=UPI00111DC443|nr:hypothetical protein [Thioflexithrix psekupsensis]
MNTISAPLSAYFCIGLAGLRPTPFVLGRFASIGQRLTQHRQSILEKALKYQSLSEWQKQKPQLNHLAELDAVFTPWIKFVSEVSPALPRRQNWVALLRALKQTQLPAAPCILSGFNDAVRLLLNDAELIYCHEQQRLVENALSHQQYRYQCSLDASMISEKISVELWQFIDPTQVSYSREKLAKNLQQLLKTWPERTLSQSAIVSELEFMMGFVEWLILPDTLSREAWEILLLLLEHQLVDSHQEQLGNVLTVLINATPRFDFIRNVWQKSSRHYEKITVPVLKFLSLFILFQAQPDSHLMIRFSRHLELPELLNALAPQLKDLIQAHRHTLDELRPLWERSQLDWLADAIERFNNLLLYTQHNQLLLSQLNQWELESAQALMHALPPKTNVKLDYLQGIFSECVYLAGQVAALGLLPQLARNLFKRHLTLYLGADSAEKIWQKPLLMQRLLEQIDNSDPRCQKLLRDIRPLLATVNEVIEDNLNFPANWFGTATALQTVTSSRVGCQHLELVMTLRMLANYRRLYAHYSAMQELQRWYLRNILQIASAQIDPVAIYTAFLGVNKILQERTQNPSPPALMKTLQLFIESLPDLLASKRLPLLKEELANLASNHVLTAYPQLAVSLGENGIKALVHDNELLLGQVAKSLLLPSQQVRGQLLRWWYSCHERLLTPRPIPVHEANLQGLQIALKTHLTAPEVERIFQIIVELHESALGFNYRPEKSETIQFNPFILEGLVWQRLFAAKGDHLLKNAEMIIKDLSKMIQDHFPQKDSILLINQLTVFFANLLQQGDVEAAWQKVQPLFDLSLQSMDSVLLEQQWQYIILQLPRYLSSNETAYWETLMQQGVQVLRQVALGRRIDAQIAATASTVIEQVSLNVAMTKSNKRRLKQALMQFLQFFADGLRTQCPSLLALNTGRYLQEIILPQVDQTGTVWHLLWTRLEVYLSSQLNKNERFSLSLWTMQLQSNADLLSEVRPLVLHVFQAHDFMFAETPREEQQWRDCISGLMSAAILPNTAPFSSRLLIQRLLLSSPVLANETANSWQQHSTALSEAFDEWLTPNLRGALIERHAELISSLLSLNQVSAANLNMPVLGVYCGLLNAHSANYLIWQMWLLARYQQEPIGLKTEELIICQLLNWRSPSLSALQAAQLRYQEAIQFQVELKSVSRKQRGFKGLFGRSSASLIEVNESQVQQSHLLIRQLGRLSAFTMDSEWLPLNASFFEYLFVHLENHDSEAQQAIISALAEALNHRYGQHHKLTIIFNNANELLPHLTLACHLLDSHQNWAERASSLLTTELSQLTSNAIQSNNVY